MKKVCI
jgi:hypothetical protein